MKAKCIKFHKFGNPHDVLELAHRQIQFPLQGEILVKMKARPINPSDLIPIKGSYAHRIPLPGIPGYEGVGTVKEVGPSVSKALIGQRVLPLRGEGTWQEFVTSPADFAILVPNSISDLTAAQLYINPLTAWITCTEKLRLKPGDTLLVNACGSAIGRIYAQLSRILGFQLIAVTRNDMYTKELLELGASHVINTSETVLHHALMEITNGYGVTAAIDSVGGPDGIALANCVKPHGILLTIGLLSGIPVNWSDVLKKTNVQVKLFHLRNWNQRVSVHSWQATFKHLFGLVQNDSLKLMKSEFQYDLMDVKEAVRAVNSSASNKGKIFLTSL